MNLPTRPSGSLSPPLLPLAAATVVGVVMTAFSATFLPTSGSPGPTPAPTHVSPVADPTTDPFAPLPPGDKLLIASGADESKKKAREQAVKDWNAKHPDIPADIFEVEGNTDVQRAKFRDYLDPAAPERVDIVNLDSVHLAEFADAKAQGSPLLVALDEKAPDIPNPITNEVREGFLTKPLLTCYWQDRLYALPYNSDVGLLFFQAGTTVPNKAEELPRILAAAPAGSRRVAIQLSPDEAFVVNVLEQLLEVNENLLNADGSRPKVVQAEWEKALTVVRGKVRDGQLWYRDDGNESAEKDTALAFKREEAVAMRNWPVWFGEIQRKPQVRSLFGPGILGGQNLAVAQKSRHKAQAIELIKFLTSAETQQKLLLEGSFVPTTQKTYEEPLVQDRIPYLTVLRDAVEDARPRPITPDYHEVSEVILRYLYPVVTDDRPLDPNFERVMDAALS
ncbi:carbohydrate ABC transporter substrate-binding protein, CUT1 family [Micromonospora rifamycinica]|uniref:Carbohydrate ABC transporter substrate-binding protein, CUT1 family n=2 Tax=Micromonospora rifamycinica TaxID=291594 RepID=A0A1C5HQL1_9ACTN|nr:carbohydrate ABC transporter substrate-binding protein, CUT1 family [Micromonospora rifamycinica]